MDIDKLLLHGVGAKVVSCEVGENTTSIWSIDFDNESCFVIFCSWRLECDDLVLATEQDASEVGEERILHYLKKIQGKRLLSFEISEQYDLILNFEDGYCVKTFSNISYFQTENGGDWDANWRFGVPEQNIIGCATNHFEMKFEKFDDDTLL